MRKPEVGLSYHLQNILPIIMSTLMSAVTIKYLRSTIVTQRMVACQNQLNQEAACNDDAYHDMIQCITVDICYHNSMTF